MRIAAITTHDSGRRYTVTLESIRGPLTAVYGPSQSGKSAVADLVGHALFGKHRVAAPGHTAADGELIVEDRDGRYRVRAAHDAHGHTRLTVAALEHPSGGAPSPIDHHTIRKLVGNLPPTVLTPLCAVSFRRPPDVCKLLSPEFTNAFQRIAGDSGSASTRRVTELAGRRDLLAQELETRIATERRASKDLEVRWRELDRLVRDEHNQAAAAEQRLKAVENSLAETDSRLRYRRLELNVELRWHTPETPSAEQPVDIDTQITRCRQILAELNEREATVRARLAQTQSARTSCAAVLADQQTWLAVSRQLAADLTGEVARLARASASQQCVCREAHPRLRPIAETMERQFAVLEKSLDDQRQAAIAVELAAEVDHLTRSQVELRRHLEHLLDRSQSHLQGTAMARPDACGTTTVFSAADAEQLESRRLELEQERFHLVEQVNAAARRLKVLRGERDAVERERAALLSTRSIEHVQRELAHVQKKLEGSTGGDFAVGHDGFAADLFASASEFLAQLSNGDLGRMAPGNQYGNVSVVNHRGETVSLDSLTAAQRDQVYLSLCLSLLSAAAKHGLWLPLVLDDPFERIDANGTAALAAVLESFSRQGHQVLVFTQQKTAADRLAAVGAEMHDMISLRQAPAKQRRTNVPTPTHTPAIHQAPKKTRTAETSQMEIRRRKKKRSSPAGGEATEEAGQSDAA
jgi:hypothetical protein